MLKPSHKHPSDFSVLAEPEMFRKHFSYMRYREIADGVIRVYSTVKSLDKWLERVRAVFVAHHIYLIADSEEFVISDRVDIKDVDEILLSELEHRHSLQKINVVGKFATMRVTNETGMNPVKLASLIGEDRCEIPRVLKLVQHVLEPWHVSPQPDLVNIGWNGEQSITTGKKEVVIAVIDDGFDLNHPCFSNVRVSAKKRNFPEDNDDVLPRLESITPARRIPADFHGTPVASLIFASEPSARFGLAPKCTFLPIRVQMHGPGAIQTEMLLKAMRYASEHADVVCCSFGYPPSVDPSGGLTSKVREELTEIAKSGGRQAKGLSMVFSAGNYGTPTYLDMSENLNGLVIDLGEDELREISKGVGVTVAFPNVEGLIVAGACNSTGMRSAYSMIRNISLVAPSNDGHYLADDLAFYNDQKYMDHGVLAARNTYAGKAGRPLDRADTPIGINRHHYTANFGGTSAAAPMIAATIGLMKSIRENLSLEQVVDVLRRSADKNLDTSMNFEDPNLQGLDGDFGLNGISEFHGAGLLNVESALQYTLNME